MSRKCLYPFTNLTVNPTGSVAPCCKYNIKNGESEISKDSLFDKNIHELFYQPAMNLIREEFNSGIEPKGCEICWDEEASNITSMRQHRDNHAKWSNHKEKYENRFEDPKMISLDFKFSSLCNLKCRICGPYCSSNWLKESQETGEFHEHTIKIFSKYGERKFINNEKNFEIFKELIPNLHIVEFYGGEPLMQPEHGKIMDILNNYPNIESCGLDLYYNTNGTIYDEKIVETWKKMGIIELNISVDDIGDRFEYQRYPAKWDEVVANITKYKTTCSDNVKIHLYCTVSLYNIFYIDELIKFNAEYLKTDLRFNLLHWPTKMSIKNLPQNIKEIVKNKIALIGRQDKKFTEKSFVNNLFGIDQVVNYMMNTEGSPEELEEFIKTTNLHDEYRHQSFEDTFNEYWILLNDKN
jgi:molybdenum cofactor biosynthesis enzyme MoaA